MIILVGLESLQKENVNTEGLNYCSKVKKLVQRHISIDKNQV